MWLPNPCDRDIINKASYVSYVLLKKCFSIGTYWTTCKPILKYLHYVSVGISARCKFNSSVCCAIVATENKMIVALITSQMFRLKILKKKKKKNTLHSVLASDYHLMSWLYYSKWTCSVIFNFLTGTYSLSQTHKS